MLKKFLSVMLFSSSYMFGSLFEYNVRVVTQDSSNPKCVTTYINYEKVFCSCGNTPTMIMFIKGEPEYYCSTHIPEIIPVKPMTEKDIHQLLQDLAISTTNGHNGSNGDASEK